MTRPKARKTSLSTRHAAAPAVEPAASPERPTPKRRPAVQRDGRQTLAATPNDQRTRQRLTFYLDSELAGQARGVMTHLAPSVHGYATLSDLLEDAVARHLDYLRETVNNGQQWPSEAAGTVRRGAPDRA